MRLSGSEAWDRDPTTQDRGWPGRVPMRHLVAATVLSVLLTGQSPSTALAAGPLELATAMAADTSVVTGASYVSVPPNGTPNDVYASALSFFPTAGSTFSILTSGNASFADDPNDSGGTGEALGGEPVRGETDMDVTILKVDLNVPSGINCLRIDFAFYSEEFPEFVGGSVNDGFVAELDTSTWTTSESVITAPDNFAFDPEGNVISINSTGATSMSAENAAGTTYDGATILLQAGTPITPGAHSLYLSIFDQGDQILDSAVFLDNLRLLSLPNPETQCAEGAVEPNTPPTVDAGGPYTGTEGAAVSLDATVTDPDTGDTLTSTWTYAPGAGVDAGASCSFANANAVDTTVTCTDDGSYTLTLTVSDGVNPDVVDTASLSLANVTPTVAITAPTEGSDHAVGATVNLSAAVADAGANDVLTCFIEWGDDTGDAGVISAGVCTGSHPYAEPGPYTITVTASDDDDADGVDTVDITVSAEPPSADLSVTQTDSPDPVTSGNAVQYFLTVTNLGPDDATGVVLVDTLPAGSTLVSAESHGCTSSSGVVTCAIGELGSEASVNISIVVRAPTVSTTTTMTNVATVSGNEDDPSSANDTSSEVTTVQPAASNPDVASGWVTANGGTVATNANKPPTKKDPMTTSVTVPPGFPGLVTIAEVPITGCPPTVVCFGQQAEITAPTTTASQPLRLVFSHHPGSLPPNTQLREITMFHDGVEVPRCATNSGMALPDPCILSVDRGKGAVRITVLSSENGSWVGGRFFR